MKNKFGLYIIWFLINCILVIFMDLAFFYQLTDNIKNSSFLNKLKWSEFWATLEWLFVIPANRMGNIFLTAPQLSLASYFFNFVGQIFTNKFLLHIPTTIDDYISMILIIFAGFISGYKIFG
jgi:uncharacterized protein (DUF486 family)